MIAAVNVKKWKGLIFWVLATLAVGVLSSLAGGDVRTVYDALVKPAFAPPAWVFPVVWTGLYVLLGFAAYLIWSAGVKQPGVREALFYYVLNLIANFFWLPIFFRWQMVWFALVWLGMMLILAAILAVQFYRINRGAGVIVLLYLLWLLYAFALNGSIAWLNG